MNNTMVCRPKGHEVQAERKENLNTLFNETVSFVRSQLVERVTNPNAVTYQFRDTLLSVLSAEVL